MKDILRIMDRDTLLEISYEDLIKYHGRLHIGGVAIAFKLMELSFELLSPVAVPRRGSFSFASALGEAATGVLDGVEMVTRARSRGNMTADPAQGQKADAPLSANGGKFYFELGYQEHKLGLALAPGLVPDEFIVLSKAAMSGSLDAEGKHRLQEVKEELAASLMSREAASLFIYRFIEA
ncbi:MAG: hypothetical protein ABRQ26_02970 [Syntrophomonadaceae bacterium]